MVKRNDNDKGKNKLTEGGDEKSRRPKHEWSKEDVELLIQLLVEEAQIQLGRGGSLVGFQHRWVNVTEKFNDRRNGPGYVDRHQCKNKGDTLKGGWRKWIELTTKQTGLGWNDEGNCCTYPEEWVARKAQENRGIYKQVNSKWPAYLVDQMELIWGQSYANGELRLTPGGVTPQQLEQSDTSDEGQYNGNEQGQGSYSMHPPSNYEYFGSGCAGASMDISGGLPYSTSFSGVGSNNKRVEAPYVNLEGDSTSPIFYLSTAASIGASLAASAFQGSPFAGFVAGSSNAYTPQVPVLIQPTTTEGGQGAVNNTDGRSKQYYPQFGNAYKPPKWDELMETTADGAVHGGKKKMLPAKKDTTMGKKKSKGSKGKTVVTAEDLNDMKSGLDQTIDGCRSVLDGLQSEASKGDGIITVQEASDIIRGMDGVTRREFTYVMMLLGDISNRAVLMTFVDIEEIRDWIHHVYYAQYGDKK